MGLSIFFLKGPINNLVLSKRSRFSYEFFPHEKCHLYLSSSLSLKLFFHYLFVPSMAAAPLSLSSNPLISRQCHLLHFPSTSFKVPLSFLKPSTYVYTHVHSLLNPKFDKILNVSGKCKRIGSKPMSESFSETPIQA